MAAADITDTVTTAREGRWPIGKDQINAKLALARAEVTRLDGLIDALEGGSSLLGYTSTTIGHADFTDTETAETIALAALSATLPAYIVAVWLEKVTDFAGGDVSAATLQVGHDVPTADPNAYVAAVDVFTGAGAGNVGFAAAERGVDQAAATFQPILPATNKITVTMTTTSDDVASLTSGAAKVHVVYRLLG